MQMPKELEIALTMFSPEVKQCVFDWIVKTRIDSDVVVAILDAIDPDCTICGETPNTSEPSCKIF